MGKHRSLSVIASIILHGLVFLFLALFLQSSPVFKVGNLSQQYFSLEMGASQRVSKKFGKEVVAENLGETKIVENHESQTFGRNEGSGTAEAIVRGNLSPAYPAISRQLGERGEVVLSFFLDKTGKAEQIIFVKSSGYKRLDGAALQAVRNADFVADRDVNRKKLRIVFELK